MEKKKILLLYDNRELDRQVIRPVNYHSFEHDWIVQHGGNAGNKLYNTAVEQYLTKPDVEYSYYTNEEPIEAINEQYDMAVYATANLFNANPAVISLLEQVTETIEQFKIPVYILGCGLQCAGYDEIASLAETIREPVERFLRAVYRTGGELALRGYATKELLDKIMPNTAVVTGCPSFYQRGRNLHIGNEKVSEDHFKPAINGNLKYLRKIGMLSQFEKYDNSVYMDQDEFAKILYFNSRDKDDTVVELVRKRTIMAPKLLAERRVQLIYDVPVWLEYFKEENISFSCGSRIHGNIAATLAGVPAKVIYRDARTRELAEFFELPNSASYGESKSLYETYLETDYTKFNQNFGKKFDVFEQFLIRYGISHDLDDRTLFEQKLMESRWKMPEIIGERKLDIIADRWAKHEKFYRSYDKVLNKIRTTL